MPYFLGVAPPNVRTEEDFDAAAKYHVAADIGYIRYFIAFIIQFQFYKVLCEVSGQYVKGDPDKPLHRCNFYGMLSCKKYSYTKCILVCVICNFREQGGWG